MPSITRADVSTPPLPTGTSKRLRLPGRGGHKATNFRLVKVENSGHFMQEEQPEFVARTLVEFFD